jgi:hypothetical protein
MSNTFVRSFAFGMDEEIKNLGQLALGTDAADPTATAAPGSAYPVNPTMQQRMPQQQLPNPFAPQPAQEPIPTPRGEEMWPQVQAGIFKGESGGDYDALFNYENRDGGQFANTKLTNMTVDEAIAFSDPNGPYAQHVKGQIGRVATPMGAYQIVGKTLRGLKKQMGLKGDERMTPELQDKLGKHLWKTAGTGQWEGYKGPADPNSVTMAARNSPPYGGDDIEVDDSDIAELEKELNVDPKVARRQYWGAALKDLSTGIGAVGRGQSPDMGRFMEAYYARQQEAKERLTELAQERRRRIEREQGHQWDLGAEARAEERDMAAETRAEARQVAAEGRAEGYDVRKENRTQERIDKDNAALGTAVGALYGDDPELAAAQKVIAINPEVGVSLLERNYAERKEAKKVADTEAQNQALGNAYLEMGKNQGADTSDIAALAARGDMVGARDLYKDRFGTTDAQLDAKVLQAGGPQALALAQRLRLESGMTDPQSQAAIDLTSKGLEKEYDGILANREKAGQLEAMQAVLDNPNLDTGAFQSAMLPFRQYLADFGIGDVSQVDQQTVVNAIGNNLISYMRKPGEGVVSDADADRFAAAAPGLGKSPIANKVLTYIHLSTLKREEAAYNARMEYFAQGGDVGNTKARDAYVESKIKEQFGEGDMLPQVDSVERAAQVPDGKPYLGPDGKFYINQPDGTTIGG